VLPKTAAQTTTGDGFTFTAYVESSEFKMDPKKAIVATIKLKNSNNINFTIGA
jgi:hypothetical protein